MNETKLDGLIKRTESYGLKPSDYIIVASGAIKKRFPNDFREVDDLDLAIKPSARRKLKKFLSSGELVKHPEFGDEVYTTPDESVEFGSRFLGLPYRKLKRHSEEFGGNRILSMPFVLKWKESMGRDKDIPDIEFLKQFGDQK